MTYWTSSLKMATSVNLNIPLWKWISLSHQFQYQKNHKPTEAAIGSITEKNSAFVDHSLQGCYIPPIIYSSAYVVHARYLLFPLLGTSNF